VQRNRQAPASGADGASGTPAPARVPAPGAGAPGSVNVPGARAFGTRHSALAFSVIVLTVFLADQITKSLVRVFWKEPAAEVFWDAIIGSHFKMRASSAEPLPLLGDLLQLAHVRNTGAAFGLLPGYRLLFTATSVLIVTAIIIYIVHVRPTGWLTVTGLALVCSGAVGNLVDRVLIGRVTDFLYVAVIDFPVFNIADSAIVVGVIIIIGILLFGSGCEGATGTTTDSATPTPTTDSAAP